MTSALNYLVVLKRYRETLHAQPDCIDTHYRLACFLLEHGKRQEASIQFNNVLSLNPAHLGATFYLGVIALSLENLEAAEMAFQAIVTSDPEHVKSLVNLGVIALKRQQGQRAIDYFTKALAFDATHLEARNNLASTFMHHDRFENALTHYAILLVDDPNNTEYLYNSGVAHMVLGHLDEAIKYFEQVLQQHAQHHPALNNLAVIHNRLGNTARAIAFLRQATEASPNDETSAFMLSVLTGENRDTFPCSDYVRNLFDNYALYYEQHMLFQLGYTVHHQVGLVLHRLLEKPVRRAVELGCGTGVTGVVLRDLTRHLSGIDLSSKMLAHARDKAIYDELIEADVVAWLEKTSFKHGLIVAADVLPYFGDLELLWSLVTLTLEAHGLFIFTHEISVEAPWKIQKSMRFCHHSRYIQALGERHGLTCLYQENIATRREDDHMLHQFLCVYRKG